MTRKEKDVLTLIFYPLPKETQNKQPSNLGHARFSRASPPHPIETTGDESVSEMQISITDDGLSLAFF